MTNGNLVLIGFMGSGKSTVARELAKISGRYFLDTDMLIEASEGRLVAQIFAQSGEEYFRELERKTALWLGSSVCNAVIATGGGFVLSNDPRLIGTVVYLHAPLELINSRLLAQERSKRPLFADEAQAKQLYTQRDGVYRDRADFVIDATDSADCVARLVWEKLAPFA